VNTPLARFAAGAFAIAFVLLIQRGAKRPDRTLGLASGSALLALLLTCGAMPTSSRAAEVLPEGTAVRAESGYIEAGWHEGTLRRAPNRCWMIYLRKPVAGGYTLIALMTINRLQVSQAGQWREAGFDGNLKDQPASCLEEGSD